MRAPFLACLAVPALLAAACGETAPDETQAAPPPRLIYQGEGFRIELRAEDAHWNSERSARALSGEIWLVVDEELPAAERPTMLYGLLYLDVDRSGAWSEVDGGTAGILDDALRRASAEVPPELDEVRLGPLTRTGVRPADPPAWRGAVRLPDGLEVGASIPARALSGSGAQ